MNALDILAGSEKTSSFEEKISECDVPRLLESLVSGRSAFSAGQTGTILGLACRAAPKDFLDFIFLLFLSGDDSYRAKRTMLLASKCAIRAGYAGFLLDEGLITSEECLHIAERDGFLILQPEGALAEEMRGRFFRAMTLDLCRGGEERLSFHSRFLRLAVDSRRSRSTDGADEKGENYGATNGLSKKAFDEYRSVVSSFHRSSGTPVLGL